MEEPAMYTTVIVPLDGSRLAETALKPGVAVASRTGAEILVLSVVRDSGKEDARQGYLRTLTDEITTVPVRCVVTLRAEPAAVIADAAVKQDPSIVCMSTHGRGGFARALLGSVAEDVVRRTAGPVLLMGPHTDPDLSPVAGQLMVCLDGSDHAERILPLATAWAQQFAMELYLVQVLDPDTARQLRVAKVPDDDVYEDAYLARVARRLRDNGVPVDWEVLHDTRPAAAIVDQARHHEASLIALSTHGRVGLRRLAIGSVAAKIVHDSPSPTLALRPTSAGT
jgi:nucleotide-binding universal stress UspA family protein